LILSGVINQALFHRDYGGSHSFGSFITEVISLVLAIMCLGLAMAIAAHAWSRARRRLGARPGRRSRGGQAGTSPDR
jgi:hypothetical protein